MFDSLLHKGRPVTFRISSEEARRERRGKIAAVDARRKGDSSCDILGDDGVLYKSVPQCDIDYDDEVCIIASGASAREEHWNNYGSQVVTLTQEQLDALNNGKQLAIDIMSCEYMLFLNGPETK